MQKSNCGDLNYPKWTCSVSHTSTPPSCSLLQSSWISVMEATVQCCCRTTKQAAFPPLLSHSDSLSAVETDHMHKSVGHRHRTLPLHSFLWKSGWFPVFVGLVEAQPFSPSPITVDCSVEWSVVFLRLQNLSRWVKWGLWSTLCVHVRGVYVTSLIKTDDDGGLLWVFNLH